MKGFTMLKAILTEAPEAALKDYYEEQSEGDLKGRWLLKVEAVDGFALAPSEGLQKALASERKKREHAEYQLKEFGDLKPEQAKELSEKMAEMDNWDPEKKLAEYKKKLQADNQKEKDQLAANHRKELEAVSKAKSELEQSLNTHLVENAAVEAISAAGCSVKLAKPILMKFLRLGKDDDGKPRVEIFDENGNVKMSPKDSYLKPMSISEYLGEMKKDADYAPMFPASQVKTKTQQTQVRLQQSELDVSNLSDAERLRQARVATT